MFLVAPRHDKALGAARARVSAAFVDEHGVVGPPAWYVARHDMFEQLIAVAELARVVDEDGLSALAAFVAVVGGRKRGAWDAATPIERRELARKHVAKIAHRRLRAAVEAALAAPAATEAGLWIEAESALPGPAVVEEAQGEDEEVSAEELARRLETYVAKADRRWSSEERVESSYHAYLCELTDDDAREAAEVWDDVDPDDVDAVVRARESEAGRCRLAAVACEEAAKIATVEALEELCAESELPSLARNIYTAKQARALLAWFERLRKSALRELVLPPLRRAVENKHGFAIVFFAP